MRMSNSRTESALVRVLNAASMVALAVLVLTMLTGATDFARNYAALLENQVRERVWISLLVNPVFWTCLIFVISLSVVVLSLAGYVLFQLHRSASGAISARVNGKSGS